ncbi:hypothetical protein BKH41_01510 [Helicobacter sp. 12S02232-10]|nr:hypothetical protein BKH41_01510 [Helicobacter sp. 12S02232-10]
MAPVDINDYPCLKKHLDGFWQEISKRTDRGVTPYNLRNCAYMSEFYRQKIVYPCIMSKESNFTYDQNIFFAPAPANIITGDKKIIKYLISFLNSKLIYFAMRQFYMGGGIAGELKTNNLLKIPIPKIQESQQEKFIKIVDEILENKAQSKCSEAFEKTLDSMIYKLYNLSNEEIQIIENDFQ